MNKLFSLLVGLNLLFLSAVPSWAIVKYDVIDLGTLGTGTQSSATAINNNGDVVGWSSTNGVYSTHAFLYSGGVMQDLAPFFQASGYSQAYGINDNGQVVGYCPDANGTAHAFLYKQGSVNYISQTPTAWHDTRAYGINNSGCVVVRDVTSSWAFTWSSNGNIASVISNLQSPWQSTGYAINDAGVAVGYLYNPFTGDKHAFFSSAIDLSSLLPSGSKSQANAINNNGQAVGQFSVSGGTHSFLYSAGVMQDIGMPLGWSSCQAEGINDYGQIVGSGNDTNYTFLDAFLYNSDGSITDLNSLIDPTSGWIIQDAKAINNHGQIVGFGMHGNQSHAFLLTPVPEPSMISMFIGLGVMILFGYIRRRF